MSVFRGTTATTAESNARNIETDIISFSLANKTGGAITASVGIFLGSTITYILFNKSINTGDSYIYSGEPIRVLKSNQIFISVSGSTDYYFTIL
jgi:hypothetical protein